jgi:hypothetical protein
MTPLHFVATKNIFTLLVDSGADINAMDEVNKVFCSLFSSEEAMQLIRAKLCSSAHRSLADDRLHLNVRMDVHRSIVLPIRK